MHVHSRLLGTCAYALISAALGAAWFGALLVPRFTRYVLLTAKGWSSGAWILALMCLVAVVLGLWFRKELAAAAGLQAGIGLAIQIAGLGTMSCLLGISILAVFQGREPSGSPIWLQIVSIYVALSIGAIPGLMMALPVIGVMTVVSFYILSWVARATGPEAPDKPR